MAAVASTRPEDATLTPDASSTADRTCPAPGRGAGGGSPAGVLDDLAEAVRCYLWRLADEELDSELRTKVAPSDVVQETLLRAQRGR